MPGPFLHHESCILYQVFLCLLTKKSPGRIFLPGDFRLLISLTGIQTGAASYCV
jgi:hypothetical protein